MNNKDRIIASLNKKFVQITIAIGKTLETISDHNKAKTLIEDD